MCRNHSMDTLRTIAALFVVILHCSIPYVYRNIPEFNSTFWVGNFFNSFTRVCVPLFVMMSGSFLIGKKENPITFYKKRMSRVLIPLIFWSVAYTLYKLLIMVQNRDVDFLELIIKITYGKPFYHMWYLFMIIGLYLITPLINHFYDESEDSHLKNLMFVGVGLLILGFIIKVWDSLHINQPFFANWFIQYTGYYILGYCISRMCKVNKPGRGKVILFLTGYILSCLAIMYSTFLTAVTFKTYLYFYEYVTPFVITGSLALYAFFASITIKKNLLVKISGLTFGVYLIHAGLFDVVKYYTKMYITPYVVVNIVIYTVISFLIPLGITWILKKLPFFKKTV